MSALSRRETCATPVANGAHDWLNSMKVTTDSILKVRQSAIELVEALHEIKVSARKITRAFSARKSFAHLWRQQHSIWRRFFLLFIEALINVHDLTSATIDEEIILLLEGQQPASSLMGLSEASRVLLARACGDKVLLQIDVPPWSFGFDDAASVSLKGDEALTDDVVGKLIKVASELVEGDDFPAATAAALIAGIKAETAAALRDVESRQAPESRSHNSSKAPAGTPESKPNKKLNATPQKFKGKLVVLKKPHDAPIVMGKAVPRLTAKQYKVVHALLTAPSKSLSKKELIKQSGCGDAANILKKLEQLEGWNLVIDRPAKSGHGYAICHPAWNPHTPPQLHTSASHTHTD